MRHIVFPFAPAGCRRRRPGRLLPIAVLLIAGPAGAQAVPGLENFTLEPPRPAATLSPTPTPVPTPSSTPTPPAAAPTSAATLTPAATAATPTPAASPSARPTRAVAPTATPTSQLTPVTPPADARPAEQPTPPPAAAATSTPVATSAGDGGWLWWLAAAGALALFAAWVLWRRRTAAADPAVEEQVGVLDLDAPSVTALPPPAPATAPPPKPAGGLVTVALKPELTVEVRPLVAGIDTLRATLDFEVTVRNDGRAPAHEVAVETWLFAASSDTRADLERLFAEPAGQALVQPFDMPPSATVDLPGQAAVAREQLAMITAGERKLFVPMLAVRATYRDRRGAPSVLSEAFMIGVERPGQDRLAPLALDRGARRYDRLVGRRFAP